MNNYIKQLLWNDNILNNNDLSNNNYPKIIDFYYITLPSLIILTLFRLFFEYIIFKPLAKKILKKPRLVNQTLPNFNNNNEILNKLKILYKEYHPKIPNINLIKDFSVKNNNLPIEDLNKYFRIKQAKHRFNIKIDRFIEALFRLMIYLITFFFGLNALQNEQWYINSINEYPNHSFLFDEKTTEILWKGFPIEHTIQPYGLIQIFYIGMQIPLYIHLLIFHIKSDHKRNDFWEMLIHHLMVIILMSFSYVGNYIRIGCLILLSHDITDIFIETAKVLNYLNKYENLSIISFNIFTFTWFYYRLYKFSTILLKSTLIHTENIASNFAYMFFNSCLSLLFLLNLYWFRVIIKMWYTLMWGGKTSSSSNKNQSSEDTDVSTDNDSDSSHFSDLGES